MGKQTLIWYALWLSEIEKEHRMSHCSSSSVDIVHMFMFIEPLREMADDHVSVLATFICNILMILPDKEIIM